MKKIKEILWLLSIGIISSILSIFVFGKDSVISMYVATGAFFGLALLLTLPETRKISLAKKFLFFVASTLGYIAAFYTVYFSMVMEKAYTGPSIFSFVSAGIVGTTILLLAIKFILEYKIENEIIPMILCGGFLSMGFLLELPISSFFPVYSTGIILWQIPMLFIIYYSVKKYSL